jgi:adenylate kinase family enzyme
MKFWLIVGIPGTGKTTIGDYLFSHHDFIHLDVEKALQKPHTLYIIMQTINEAKEENKDLVITWGFLPEKQAGAINDIKSQGARLVWFGGSRESARKAFIDRGTVSVEALEQQMARIDSVDIKKAFDPIYYDPFDKQGNFKSKSKIVSDLQKITTD